MRQRLLNKNNMTILELLKQYADTIDAIFKSFGIDNCYGEIDDRTSDFFSIDDNTVEYSDKKFEDEGVYLNSIIKKYENDTHYLLYINNGCGQRFYQIFDKSKEIIF
jgi:hypothetical protein